MSSTEMAGLTGEVSSDERPDYDLERNSHNVQSPRIVLPSKRNGCVGFIGCLVIIVLLLFVRFTYRWEEDSVGSIHLEARVGGAWYVHHKPPSCSDLDCCHIHTKNEDYTISPRRIVKQDKMGTNCPSLSTLVTNYNVHHVRYFGIVNCSETNCCSIDIFWDELIRNNITVEEYIIPVVALKGNVDTCPTIKTLIVGYEKYYYEENGSTIIIMVMCVLACYIMCPSKGDR